MTADVLGRSHVLQRAKKRGIDVDLEKFADPLESKVFQGGRAVIPKEAIRFLQTRVPLPVRSIEKLVETARVRSARAIKELIDQLVEVIDEELVIAARQGLTVDQFSKRVNGILQRFGVDPLAPFRLETIFRTNNTAAYTAGRLEQIEHPDVAQEFQWLQYNAVLDGATRPTHAAMNGRVYRSDSPIWKDWMPPNGFNCRCSVTPVAQKDIDDEDLVVRRAPPRIGGNPARPDVGFRENTPKALKRNPEAGFAPPPRPKPKPKPRPAAPPPRPPRAAAPKRPPRKPVTPEKRKPEKPVKAFVPRPPPTESEALRGRTFEVVESVNPSGKTIFTPTIAGSPRGKPFRRRFAADRQLKQFKQMTIDRALLEHKEAEELRREFESDPGAFRNRAFDFEL